MRIENDLSLTPIFPALSSQTSQNETITEEKKKLIIDKLCDRFPELDSSKIHLILVQPYTWNNGALGYPIKGEFYTQALVPGYILTFEQEGFKPITIHTNKALTYFRMPGMGAL